MADSPRTKLRIKTRATTTEESPKAVKIENPTDQIEMPIMDDIDESKLLEQPVPTEMAIPSFIKNRVAEEEQKTGKEIPITLNKVEDSKQKTELKDVGAVEELPDDPVLGMPHKTFGERHEDTVLSDDAKDIHLTHDVHEIKSKQYFSERHKESVEQNNLLVQATRTKGNPAEVFSEDEFMEMVKNNFNGCKIKTNDADYAVAASRPVIASVNTYYSIVCLHSGYKANMLGLCYLDKSRLNTVAEDPYADRIRLYKIIYEKIESMTGGKPKFEDWLKMTALADVEPLLYGIYAASYPTSQPFEVTCNKCNSTIKVNTDPESIIATFDNKAYEEVNNVLYNVKTHKEIKEFAPMYKEKIVPIMEKRSVVTIREPSLHDYLNMISFFNGKEKEFKDFDSMIERSLYAKSILIPDIAANQHDGTKAMVKVEDINLIVRFLSSLMTDNSVTSIDDAISNLNTEYDVKFEIPKFKCNNLMKDENGKITGEACGNDIGPISLNLENLLFFRVRRVFQKDNE